MPVYLQVILGKTGKTSHPSDRSDASVVPCSSVDVVCVFVFINLDHFASSCGYG